MSRRPILSIGIPTYNRSGFLRGMIASVLAEVDRHGVHDDVEVVVSDNASPDDTPAVVAALQAQTRVRIRYHRNDSNCGLAKNLVNTLLLSSGEYWFFSGDDEVMQEGVLPRVLHAMRARPGTAVFMYGPGDAASVGGETAPLALPEAARRFFYYIGNAGLSAIHTDTAKAEVNRWGAERFDTWWPQTQIAYLTMAASGVPQPLVHLPITVVESPHHAGNTVYSSWYIWETTLHSLYRIALDLRPQIGSDAFRAACANLFRGDRFVSTAKGVFLYTTLFDLPEEVRETRASAWRSLRTATGGALAPLVGLWVIAAMPRALKMALLKGVAGAGLRELEERRDIHAQRREEAARGEKAMYRANDL